VGTEFVALNIGRISTSPGEAIARHESRAATRSGVAAAAALLALVLSAAPLRAADLAPIVKAPPLIPVAPVVFGWTGFYGGVHGGYGWGKKMFVDNFPTFDGELDADTHIQGGLAGLQFGYNYQFNWLVVGAEANFSWADVRQDFPCFHFGDQACSSTAEWFASLTGRVGVTTGPALFYAKGGMAWVHDRFTDVATCSGSQPRSSGGIPALCGDQFSSNQTRPGWVVGGGFEYRFARNWSAMIEYNYMDFGKWSAPFSDGANGFFTEEIHQTVNIVKVGLNYYFDWGAANAQARAAYAAADLPDEPSHKVIAFSAFDASKYSYSGALGALIAPYKDMDTSGLRVFLMGEAGAYKYQDDTGNFINGVYESGDALVGWAFEGDNYSVNVLAGGNVINHSLQEPDPTNSVQGTRFGAKVRTDMWINPTPVTLVYGEGEYSTAFRTYDAKLRLGYDVTESKRIFVGPEVAVAGNERFNQWRVGAHVTQLKFGQIQFDVSGGYANDSVVGTSGYGNIEASMNF
jgi:outer membrane immunogenic protein